MVTSKDYRGMAKLTLYAMMLLICNNTLFGYLKTELLLCGMRYEVKEFFSRKESKEKSHGNDQKFSSTNAMLFLSLLYLKDQSILLT